MAEDGKEEKARCIDAGIKLLRENVSYREATPILYKNSFHLQGIDPVDFKVPHSEAAIFEKAAGRDIVAFFTSRNLAFVAFSDDGGCGFAYGGINEMLTPALANKVREAYFPEQSKEGAFETCPRCGGTRVWPPGSEQSCDLCGGTGSVPRR